MRGALGVLLIIVGVTMAYLVLKGALPTPTPLPTPTTPGAGTPQPGTSYNGGLLNVPGHTGNGPTGLPTMAHFSDQASSMGGLT